MIIIDDFYFWCETQTLFSSLTSDVQISKAKQRKCRTTTPPITLLFLTFTAPLFFLIPIANCLLSLKYYFLGQFWCSSSILDAGKETFSSLLSYARLPWRNRLSTGAAEIMVMKLKALFPSVRILCRLLVSAAFSVAFQIPWSEISLSLVFFLQLGLHKNYMAAISQIKIENTLQHFSDLVRLLFLFSSMWLCIQSAMENPTEHSFTTKRFPIFSLHYKKLYKLYLTVYMIYLLEDLLKKFVKRSG